MSARLKRKKAQAKYYREHKQQLNATRWGPRGRNTYYVKTYGITIAEFESRIEAQHGLCPIGEHPFGPYGKQGDAPCLDHDHKTNQNRGVICRNHNKALGGFNDSIEEMQSGLDYLKQHKEK